MLQAMRDFADRMIQDSDRFDDSIEEMFKRFDKNSSFTYFASADVFPDLTFKTPYDQLKVRQLATAFHPIFITQGCHLLLLLPSMRSLRMLGCE